MDLISKNLPWLLLGSAVVALGIAYTAQYAFGYEPCVLCLYQRIPYAVIAVIAFAAWTWKIPGGPQMVAYVSGAVFAVGAGLAFYHVGVEQLWWTSAAPCGADGPVTALSTQDLLASLNEKPEKSCSDIDWTFLGISMATYNVVASLALAIVCLMAGRHVARKAV